MSDQENLQENDFPAQPSVQSSRRTGVASFAALAMLAAGAPPRALNHLENQLRREPDPPKTLSHAEVEEMERREEREREKNIRRLADAKAKREMRSQKRRFKR